MKVCLMLTKTLLPFSSHKGRPQMEGDRFPPPNHLCLLGFELGQPKIMFSSQKLDKLEIRYINLIIAIKIL